MEKLIIENFAGIKRAEINLKKINILIGPQASGKSIIAKLLFYFKSFLGEIRQYIPAERFEEKIEMEYINRFISYFPTESWPAGHFKIEYRLGNDTFLSIFSKKQKNKYPVKFEYSNNIKKLIRQLRKLADEERTKVAQIQNKHNIDESLIVALNYWFHSVPIIRKEISEQIPLTHIFIPAGRSFFSIIQSNIFALLSNSNIELDDFIKQFGSVYESFKQKSKKQHTRKNKISVQIYAEFKELFNDIICSEYLRENEKDYLLHKDKRKVNLANASSGQQEILPLLIILQNLIEKTPTEKESVLYIEEPEAHLFPTAQKIVIRLLAKIFNIYKRKFQIIVTTHSPYILTSFNNLIYAGNIAQRQKNTKRLYKIIPKSEIIYPEDVCAYSLTSEMEIIDILDSELGLISRNIIDDVSNEISVEFDKLLELESSI